MVPSHLVYEYKNGLEVTFTVTVTVCGGEQVISVKLIVIDTKGQPRPAGVIEVEKLGVLVATAEQGAAKLNEMFIATGLLLFTIMFCADAC